MGFWRSGGSHTISLCTVSVNRRHTLLRRITSWILMILRSIYKWYSHLSLWPSASAQIYFNEKNLPFTLHVVHVFAMILPPRSFMSKAPLSMGILQARILEWVAMPFSRGSSQTQGLNPGLPHCRWILYYLSYQRSLSLYIYIYIINNT